MVNRLPWQPEGDGPHVVARPRLVAQLDEAVRSPLTVITAPAGYGKTVLLDQWAAGLDPGRLAWVEVERHHDAATVLHHLDEAVLGLAAIPGAVLVLDGLDTPGDDDLVEQLNALVLDAPPGLHIVATRRAHWAAARRRGRLHDDVAFLDQDDLALTPSEATELLRSVAGLDLSDHQVEPLVERAEGWPAALQLAAIALRGQTDPDAVIEGFSGDNRHLAAFVHVEVLAREPESVRRFLLETSVLASLDPALGEAVTGDPAAGMMLRLLEHRGLFTSPVDGAGGYRYHRLFRDVLRAELRRLDPEAELVLLRRAATWLVEHREPGAAAAYLIEAEAWDGLIELVDEFGGDLVDHGAADQVLGWLEAIPAGHEPHALALRRAYVFTMSGQARRAAQVLHDLPSVPTTRGEQVVVDALRATWVFSDVAPEVAIPAADAVLRVLDHIDPSEIPNVAGLTTPSDLLTMAAGSRAFALWSEGDVDGARWALRSVPRHKGQETWTAQGSLALVDAWSGNLSAAADGAHRALASAADAQLLNHPWTLEARLASVHVARERGHLRVAERLLAQTGRILGASRRPALLSLHTVEGALLHLATGHPERGSEEISTLRSSGGAPPHPGLAQRLATVEVRLLVATGRLDRARAVLDEVVGPRSPALTDAAMLLAVTVHDLDEARVLLERWPVTGTATSDLERELWAAVIDLEGGSRRRALLRAAVVVAEGSREARVRLFLDAGRPAERLLRTLAHAAPTPYLIRLVELMGPAGHRSNHVVGLSDRELEVIRYLPSRMSSAEIAAGLYVSLNTLKTHLRAIYQKLGVNGREGAVRRAEELGIA